MGQPDGQITQFHNQPAHWASLGSLLRACDARSRVVTDDIRVLTPESRAKIDVIVNASTALRPSDREYFAIQSRIDAGAGYVGVHVANTVHLTSRTPSTSRRRISCTQWTWRRLRGTRSLPQ